MFYQNMERIKNGDERKEIGKGKVSRFRLLKENHGERLKKWGSIYTPLQKKGIGKPIPLPRVYLFDALFFLYLNHFCLRNREVELLASYRLAHSIDNVFTRFPSQELAFLFAASIVALFA